MRILTACTTPALDGISVTTRSEKLFRMRKEILTLILTSHPLDCPSATRAGSAAPGSRVRTRDRKGILCRPATDRRALCDAAHPLLELRCVLCLRCYRACREIAAAGLAISDTGSTPIAAVNAPTASPAGSVSPLPGRRPDETLSPLKSRPGRASGPIRPAACGFGCG